jgi:ADP-dependent NAD(P)H-hydrate dehydratase / NAD(P)H-hydrate epimerase
MSFIDWSSSVDRTYWHQQPLDKPLYPDLLWSRPENRAHAGKLLIVGGNVHGFAAAADAYSETQKAGIGTARVLLPNSLQKTVGRMFEAGEYAPSTPSGSFAQQALAELLDTSAWSDGVLLAGNFGRNSETAILLEYYLEKFSGQVTITKDAADYFLDAPGPLMMRPSTLLVLSFSQLQKLGVGSRYPQPFTSDMGLLKLVDTLHEFGKRYAVKLITKCENTLYIADSGAVITTSLSQPLEIWRTKIAAHAAVWWLQNPSKTQEALASSIVSQFTDKY